MTKDNRYKQIIETVFNAHYEAGVSSFEFKREELKTAAKKLRIDLPANLGDIISSFRFRAKFPESILKRAPSGKEWQIKLNGRGQYLFVACENTNIEPRSEMTVTKIPDATPSIIGKYRMDDEQALLAKLRYNRLVDVFLGIACYSLQNHLRTTVPGMGQVETDEIYVGIDKRGAHYVIPVQAKGGKDKLSMVQIEQDMRLCESKFPGLIPKPVAAQFMSDEVIALMEFERTPKGVALSSERHYLLVPADLLSSEDIRQYAVRTMDGSVA